MSTGGGGPRKPPFCIPLATQAPVMPLQGSLRGVIDFDLDRAFMIPSSPLSSTTWEDDFNTSHIGVAVSCYQ